MKTLLFLFLSILFALNGFSQSVQSRVQELNEQFLDFEFTNLKKAADALDQALALAKKANYKEGIADTYIHMGYFEEDKGNYPDALKRYFKALKISESIGYKDAIKACYNNIGNVYNSQGDYPKALKNYEAYLKINEANNNRKGISIAYNNLGIIYEKQGDYRKALSYYQASLEIDKAIGNKTDIAISHNNIGSVYCDLKEYDAALKNHFAAYKLQESIKDKGAIPASCLNIGFALYHKKEYLSAEKYLLKARKLAEEIGDKEYLSMIYSGLVKVDSATGDFKKAYEDHKTFIQFRDSLDNEQTKQHTLRSQLTYDFEKKEAVAKAQQDLKLKEKEQQRNYFIVGFAIVALLALLILRSYSQKRKANIIILEQKQEVERSKVIIEEKNKDITDSINYARRIQQAMLPERAQILNQFPESFVLFKPKDIVSGDFYFYHKSDNGTAYIAAADCTGHGVPGAFMSLIGAEKLQEAVSNYVTPSAILKNLNKGIKTSLRQSDDANSTRDGMDIALCAIDTNTKTLKYAGANRPLWIIRNGHDAIEEVRATKKAIGGLTEESQQFDEHELHLKSGDLLYICTDGYADQFGGLSGKKLLTKKFKDLLLKIRNESMSQQEYHLNQFVEEWMGTAEQVDDILVIGVRV